MNDPKLSPVVMVIVAVAGLGLMTLLMGGICMLLSNTKCTGERSEGNKRSTKVWDFRGDI